MQTVQPKNIMGKLVAVPYINIFMDNYFTFNELKCKCGCNTFYASRHFLRKLMNFRQIYGYPMIVTSCYRCKNHPQYSTNHDGYAIDIFYEAFDSSLRFSLIKAGLAAGFTRIGISDIFIHFDCNPEWDGTASQNVIWVYPMKFKN